MSLFSVHEAASQLDIEQVRDIRRSVLCGELNWPREAVEDPVDAKGILFLASAGHKPVASLRLVRREGKFQVECLAVLERFRRQGIGRALLEAAEAKAKACCQAHVIGPNRAFFEACGYAATSIPELLEKCPES